MTPACSSPGRIRQRLFVLLGSERGMALPTAMFATVAALGLGGAAVLSSVNVQQGSKRDSGSKSAIAAADAGASVALLRMNRFQGSLSESNPCVGPGGEPQPPEPDGWCPQTPAESVGSASFAYRVSAYEEGTPLTVVATGSADTVSRRIEVGLVSFDGENVFSAEQLIGENNITLEGTPDIRTDIGTNGSVESDGSGTVCGDIRHGIGKSAPEPDCDGEVNEGNKTLPDVVPPEDIATNNSNCRLALTCEDPSEVDTFSKKRSEDAPWNAETRTITITKNATLTMGGTDYFVCKLVVQNGELIMADGATVRIFFDTPENCGIAAGKAQIEVTGNGNIVSTGYNPAEGKFNVPGLYVQGSPDIPTKVKLEGNAGVNELVLYAPHSDLEMGGSASWTGMFAGSSVRMHGTPTVEADAGINPPDIAFSGLWERTHYVECSGAGASPPDANC